MRSIFIPPSMHAMARRMTGSLAALALIAGCAQEEGSIDSEGAVFDGIAPEAQIELLGTEPFWSIAIEPDPGADSYTARLSTSADIAGTAFAAQRFAGNNGLGFSGQIPRTDGTGGRAVQIAITPGECSDQMSGRVYPYTASVRLGDELLLGCGYTSDEPFTPPRSP